MTKLATATRLTTEGGGTLGERIIHRIKAAGGTCYANDTLHEYIQEGELEALEKELAQQVEGLMTALAIDWENDHNSQGTPERVARMFIREVFKGRYTAPPRLTAFPNAKDLDQIYTVGPITVRSACSHHLVPIIGQAWVGIIPTDQVIGLSKFTRLTEWVLSRPQIQEEAVVQLADQIEQAIQPQALGLVIRAKHLCMTWRGVRDTNTEMVTSVMRGLFREKPEARAEFMVAIRGQGYYG